MLPVYTSLSKMSLLAQMFVICLLCLQQPMIVLSLATINVQHLPVALQFLFLSSYDLLYSLSGLSKL